MADNTIHDNEGDGIRLTSNGAVVSGSRFERNAGSGIVVPDDEASNLRPSGNRFIGNTAVDNGLGHRGIAPSPTAST